MQTRNSASRMPTAAERTGDFSGLVNTAGQQVVIYDPLTKLPFPGNIIPANRINPVAATMIKYLPLPDVNVDNGTNNYNRTSLINNNFETEIALKVEHKFTDKVSLTGFYLYNRTNEPCQNYFGSADQNDPNRFADPLDYILVAASAAAGVEQHLGAERQLGDVAALRHDALPRQQHAEHSVRSVDARLQVELQQPDHGAEVPAGRPDQRLRRAGRPDARRDQPDPDQLEVDQRQRGLLAVLRRAHRQGRRRLPQDRDGQLPAG